MRFVKTYWLEMLMVIPLFAYIIRLHAAADPDEHQREFHRPEVREEI